MFAALWAKGIKQESHESHVDNKKASAYPEMTPKCSLFFYRISPFLCFVFIGVLFHSKLLQPLQDRVCPASAIIKCPRSGCQSQIRSEVYSTPACLGLVNVFAPPIPALTGWDMSLVPPIGHVGRAHWNPLTSMSLAGTRSICQLCEKEATCDNPAPYTRKHSDAGGS